MKIRSSKTKNKNINKFLNKKNKIKNKKGELRNQNLQIKI